MILSQEKHLNLTQLMGFTMMQNGVSQIVMRYMLETLSLDVTPIGPHYLLTHFDTQS